MLTRAILASFFLTGFCLSFPVVSVAAPDDPRPDTVEVFIYGKEMIPNLGDVAKVRGLLARLLVGDVPGLESQIQLLTYDTGREGEVHACVAAGTYGDVDTIAGLFSAIEIHPSETAYVVTPTTFEKCDP
jgi:hypothetical protein